MNSLVVPNDVFFAHILDEIDSGNAVKIPARGRSMLPLIRPSVDEIELKPLTAQSISKGNIVLAKTEENKYIVHRIEKIEQNSVTLRGDGNWQVREMCKKNNIFAEVTSIYRKNKRIDKNSFWWNLAKNCWFSNRWLRRVFLKIHREFNKIGAPKTNV